MCHDRPEKRDCCHSHGHHGHHGHHPKKMMIHMHHGMHGHHGKGECCCEEKPFGFHRHFVSSKEKLEMLEKYKEELENELEGVKEHIAKLTKE